jgi:hypothetical protein
MSNDKEQYIRNLVRKTISYYIQQDLDGDELLMKEVREELESSEEWETAKDEMMRIIQLLTQNKKQIFYTADPDTGKCFGCAEVMSDCAIHVHEV